jgi:hypothetical protein
MQNSKSLCACNLQQPGALVSEKKCQWLTQAAATPKCHHARGRTVGREKGLVLSGFESRPVTAAVAGQRSRTDAAVAAMARDTGRASKTLRGARRQTILVSGLESLRPHLPTFTLSSVVGEILTWSATGRSCFATLLTKLKLTPPAKSPLNLVLPVTA